MVFSHMCSFQTFLSFRGGLKVHKLEIFFGFDFEIFIISLLVMSIYYYFTKKNFVIGPLFFEVGKLWT